MRWIDCRGHARARVLGQTLIDRGFLRLQNRSMETDTPCTPDDRRAIVAAAEARQGFLRWLCGYLRTTDDKLIRHEAADAIEQLAGLKQ